MLTVIIIALIIHDEVWNPKQQNDKNDLCADANNGKNDWPKT